MAIGDVSEVKKVSFWVSQVFILVATILGVFLAASQGFKQAMEFDTVKSLQSNYYLRKSLHSELTANVGHVREFISKVEKNVLNPRLNLDTFVWNSMSYSPATLETPSDLLGEAQRFYRRAAEIMATSYYNDLNRAKFLGELADHMEKNVLPKFESNTLELKEMLRKKDISV